MAPAPRVDDAALVRRALDGDRWAEEALYRRHVRRVSDVAIRVLGRAHEAEDVVQDTFLKALQKLPTLRDPSLFERWLMRIAMNMVRGKLRKRKLLRTLGLDRSVDDATLERMASPSTPPDVRAELAGIDAVLRDVTGEQRLAWMLHCVEGWSLPEVASTLGCSLATVKRRIRAARDRIEEHLEEPELLKATWTAEDPR
ncbi:MAG TPA: RNA polymerase sigma factor [Sandaracinaceae bacterium LLY-WYZ-13_1]|nr:RNA polymerase sigma factor [Sandaracinaceae bacterium LLY-WYZ-13_1]